MGELRISLPDPGRVGDDPTFPRLFSGYITLHNTNDFPVRFTIHSAPDSPRHYDIQPGELMPVSGQRLVRVEIAALPRPRRPRKGLMRFGRE